MERGFEALLSLRTRAPGGAALLGDSRYGERTKWGGEMRLKTGWGKRGLAEEGQRNRGRGVQLRGHFLRRISLRAGELFGARKDVVGWSGLLSVDIGSFLESERGTETRS